MQKLINFKELLKGIIIICLYFVLPSIIIIPFSFVPKFVLYILVYFLLAIFFITIYRKDIVNGLEDMKKNFKNNIKVALKYWARGLFIMYISSIIIGLLGITESINQQNNIDFLKSAPVIEFVLACVFAPIIEELVFRRSLAKAFNNDLLYVIVTGFIFGFIHIFSSLNDIRAIIYLIPYGALGIALACIYKKTNNIFSSMIIHATHNFIALLLALIFTGGL